MAPSPSSERFWLSLKSEAFPSRLVPLGLDAMRSLLTVYVGWFNEHRPHQGIDGDTPLERASGCAPARNAARFEPRARYPDPGDGSIIAARPAALTLRLVRTVGARHLPVVSVDAAA